MSDGSKRLVGLSPAEKRALLARLLQRKAAEPEACPLSHGQLGLWVLQRLAPDSVAYHVMYAARAWSYVDVARLRLTVQALMDRHGALRTTFVERDGRVMQQIHPHMEVCFHAIDASDWSDGHLEEQLLAQASRPFDLERGPILRAYLFSRSAGQHVLMLVMHHIGFDGWSAGLLLHELDALYTGGPDRAAALLPPVAAEYKDYVRWQAEVLAGPEGERLANYWQRQLAHQPVVNLPTDRPRPAVQSYQGTAFLTQVDEGLTRRLKALARATGATLQMILLAALQVLISRYSGQEEVVVGSTAVGRTRDEFAGTIGCFANPVVLRADLSGDPPFRAFAAQVRDTVLEAIEHQDYPFALLVDRLQPVRDPSRSPLFDINFVWNKAYWLEEGGVDAGAPARSSGRPLRLEPLIHRQLGAAFDLILTVFERSKSLTVAWAYNTDLFEAATISCMAGHFQTLLERIVEDPDRPVSRLQLLSWAEREALLARWNTAEAAYPAGGCLHELFEARVAERPEAAALSFERESVRYGELNRRANRLAHHLRALGVGPDVLVGLCVERSVEMVVAILGILKAGGAYVPLDPAYPRERLIFMLEDAGVPVLVSQRALTDRLPLHAARIVWLDGEEEELAGESEADPPRTAHSDNLAYVIYTSGSTGKPKGVQVTHYNVVRLFEATHAWFGFDERDVWTLFHSHAFDFSVWELWGALLFGGRLVVVPYMVSRSPEAFYRLLGREQVTVLNQTPSAFRQLMRVEDEFGPAELDLRLVIFGGEALELQGLRRWFERHGDRRPQLVNMYGITETTVHVTYRPITLADLEARAGSVIGQAIPDLEVYVLDRHREPAPIGVQGELYVGGAGVARGYLNRPELTAERFIPHPFRPAGRLYRSGDLARYLTNGDLEYLGRIDHQVKIRGFRIELGEIEAVLSEQAGVREAVVLAREDRPGDRRLVAYVGLAPGKEASAPELRRVLREKLPEYMVPAAFVVLETLPLTANGKIDRKALPAPDSEQPRGGEACVGPRTALEAALAEIWQGVLGLSRVGVHDNFFELGGDSILSIQVIGRARQAGITVTPNQLFRHPTIAELAALAAPAVRAQAEQGVVRGAVPLTPIQQWFFEQEMAAPHHWNQAFVFEVSEPLELGLLEGALQALVRHHDALRLRFVRAAEGWRQTYGPVERAGSVRRVDLAGRAEGEREQAIGAVAKELQASLDLVEGPLVRVVYCDGGMGRAGRLLVVIHHLAVDGVSWRILVEDLERAYAQLREGRAIELPAKTTSYRQWAERLEAYALSAAVRAEGAYWRGVVGGERVALPLDVEPRGENTEASARTIAVRLGVEETQALLQQVPKAYNTQINDVLLTALAQAVTGWTGGESLFVDVEGHGREDLFEDVDLSRTVGWFTTIYPARLTLQAGAGPGEALKAVKEQLRAIPNRGIGYGLLRYLSGDGALAAELGAQPPAELVFNYLGQFDRGESGTGLLRFTRESPGPCHSPRGRRQHLLEVLGFVLQGALHVEWTYSAEAHRVATMERLAQGFLEALHALITHCLSPDAGGYTPSDFPLAKLDQRGLDRLLGSERDVEDLYPLSPMQQLFYSVDAAESRLGFEQWHCTLHGELNASAFRRAWEQVVDRHTILRTAFVSDGLAEPLQLVRRGLTLPWMEDDWRGLSGSDQAARLGAYLSSDRDRGFDLARAPLMRLALIRVGEETHHFIWSTHHLLIDGWSWPLMFRDVAACYEALCQGQKASLGRGYPYRDYIAWLARQSLAESEGFWRRELRGVSRPTSLGVTRTRAHPATRAVAFRDEQVALPDATAAGLRSLARQHQVTLSTLMLGTWALMLSRYTGEADVVVGTAFSGRPADVAGVESMVGPCVNNLPVRVRVTGDESLPEWLKRLQEHQVELNRHQHTALMQIQAWSEVPWRLRLFESLLVFQNYAVDEAALRLGSRVEIRDLVGPDRTSYPLTIMVVPGPEIIVKMIYDPDRFAPDQISRMLRDFGCVSEAMVSTPRGSLAAVLGALESLPLNLRVESGLEAGQAVGGTPRPSVVPRTEMERLIAGIWQDAFQVDEVSVNDNFFDLGGYSVLLIQVHRKVCEALGTDLSIVSLFQYPTVGSLARFLTQELEDQPSYQRTQERARRQKDALARQAARVRRT